MNYMSEDNNKNFHILMKVLDINIQMTENIAEMIKIVDGVKQRTDEIKKDVAVIRYIWVPIIISLLSIAGNIVALLIK